MKRVITAILVVAAMYSCGNQNGSPALAAANEEKAASANPAYDPKRGEGKFKEVEVSVKLDVAMADGGSKIYAVKCGACHKTTGEKLVGPGWKGVTERHAAPWIMNFITNTDEMITKDPAAQAQLEICLVRMPNQNLSDTDARNLLEFMRKNDGVK
ncbi:MAG: c-type cytochrome [Bacteroidota bacterium]